jgi:anti-sigma factor RsiW
MRRERRSTCDQAGRLISLRLDDELSELEAAALERHLGRCAACSALATELGAIALSLRAAPLVAYAPLPARAERSRRAVALPRPGARTFAAVASAAAAAIAILIFGSLGGGHQNRSALEFRSAGEEVRFVEVEQHRIEPLPPVRVATPPPMNPRGLL